MGIAMILEIECGICDKPVKIQDRERFLGMVKAGEHPLCRQCRRYAVIEKSSDTETIGTARKIKREEETGVTEIGLVEKQGKNVKNKRPLASHKLKRVLKRGCESCCGND